VVVWTGELRGVKVRIHPLFVFSANISHHFGTHLHLLLTNRGSLSVSWSKDIYRRPWGGVLSQKLHTASHERRPVLGTRTLTWIFHNRSSKSIYSALTTELYQNKINHVPRIYFRCYPRCCIYS